MNRDFFILNKEKYNDILSKDDDLKVKDYYIRNKRWIHYLSAVADVCKEMEPFQSVLEIGPYKFPIILNSDIMDIRLNAYTEYIGKFYEHDAGVIPWDFIDDKQYDLVVASNIWEHLNGKQVLAFKEVMRICKRAIFAFPYKWPDHVEESHRNITDDIISEWTCNVKPIKIIHVPPITPQLEIIYVFNFEK